MIKYPNLIPASQPHTHNMKIQNLLLLAAVLALMEPRAQAASGSWSNLTTGGNWSDTANWTSGTVADGSGSTATFSLDLTAANTVHLDSARTLTSLVFADTTTPFFGWTLDNNGNAANILTLAGATPTITVGTSSTATISAVIDGTTTLTKAGTGTLILSGLNTYTGSTTTGGTAGSLSFNTIADSGVACALGQGSAIIVNGSGAGLTYTGGAASSDRTLTIGNNKLLFSNTGGGLLTLSGNVTTGTTGNFQLRSGNVTLSGVISGAGLASVNSATSTLTLSNSSNSFTSTLGAVAGTISVSSIANSGNVSAAGAGSQIDLGGSATSGTLVYTGGATTTNRTINLAGTTGGATIDQSGTGALTFSSAFTAGGVGAKTLTLQGSTAGTGEIQGAIVDSSSGATSLTKAGTGTWTLSGTNTYTGITTVNGGTLLATKAAALPGYTTSAKVVINGGTAGVLMGDGVTTGWSTAQVDTLLGNATKTSGALGIDTSNADLTQWAAFTTTNLGALGITKLGTGNLTLNLANTFNGTTTITGGKIAMGSATALQSSTFNTTGSTGGVGLNVTGGLSSGTLTLGGLSGAVDLATAITDGYSSVTNLTLNPGAGISATYSGVIADGAPGMTLTKTGAGTLTLNGTNTYTGKTILGGASGSYVYINSIADAGTASALGAGATIDVTVANQYLTYTGGSVSSNRTLNLNNNKFNISSTGGGLLTLAGNVTTSGTFGNLQLRGGNVTVSGVVSGAGQASVNSASATLTLTNGSNSFTSALDAYTGTISVSSIANSGTNSAAGNGTIINIGGSTGNGALIYTGGATTTNRTINLAGTTGGATIDQSGATGALVFNGAFTFGAGSKTLTLQGSNGGTGEISSAISNNSVANVTSLTKAGTGTWTLSGASSYTGTTTVSAGTMIVSVDKGLGDTTSVVLNGGTLDIRGDVIAGTVTLGTNAGLSFTSGIIKFQLGAAFDQIVSAGGAGAFTISGGTFALDVTSGTFSYGNSYAVLSGFGGSNSVSGLGFSGYDSTNYSASLGTNGVLSFTAIPEPTTVALVVLSLVPLVAFARRRKA